MDESSDDHDLHSQQLDNHLLPSKICWGGIEFVKCEGFWFPKRFLAGIIAARSQFKARDGDIILASSMKTGTTWLKALIPSIVNHHNNTDYDPFIHNHPNALIPSLEIDVFSGGRSNDVPYSADQTRLFRTHAPYLFLSESIKNAPGCKIVYITRDPKDVVVSMWHFLNARNSDQELLSLDEAFECFCRGVHPFGPFHEHVVRYWDESLKRPDKILFLRYEDLKKDPRGEVKKLACFLGRKDLEENDEEVDKILWKCSFDRLKNLEVNKIGVDPVIGMAYKAYFRRGAAGDWKNHLSQEMKEQLDKITKTKLAGSDLEL